MTLNCPLSALNDAPNHLSLSLSSHFTWEFSFSLISHENEVTWLSYSTHNRSWPCPGTSAGTLHHQTRPKYSYSEGGASAEGKRAPQPLHLGTEGVLSWGCFWRSLTKVVLEPKDFVHVTTSALRTGFCSHIPYFVF